MAPPTDSEPRRRLRALVGPTLVLLVVGTALFALLVFLFAALELTGVASG